jgi:triosephosphate isomerase (TIM)
VAKVFLTAQNIDIYDGDDLDLFARTGSTSVEQVARAGAEGVILGHPETADSPTVVKMKLQTVLNRVHDLPTDSFNKITVMAGESWEDFQGQSTSEVAKLISKQLLDILSVASTDYVSDFVVGYDPKWGSRGSGHDDAPPPEPDFISEVAGAIRSGLVNKYGKEIGTTIPIIYGGRSTPDRTLVILADKNIDGLILGSACNTVQKTKEIIDAMRVAKPNERKVLHANFKAFNLADSYEDYATVLHELDDSFIVYMSPCHADLSKAAEALA